MSQGLNKSRGCGRESCVPGAVHCVLWVNGSVELAVEVSHSAAPGAEPRLTLPPDFVRTVVHSWVRVCGVGEKSCLTERSTVTGRDTANSVAFELRPLRK